MLLSFKYFYVFVTYLVFCGTIKNKIAREITMKRMIVCIMIICAILCGCGKEMPLNDSETNKNETIQSGDVLENTEASTNQEVENSVEIPESNIEHAETYTKKMETIYSEAKSEAATMGAEKTEILFNEIPWGSNFETAESKMQQIDGYSKSRLFKGIVRTLEYFLCGDFTNNHGDKSFAEIGGLAKASSENLIVAGYNILECRMYFSGIIKDDKNVLSDEDSVLYAAGYIIEASNTESTKEDLKTKISSIYGEPNNTRDIELYDVSTTQEYIYWYGANDTVLVLTADGGGWIYLSYVWLGGEELLNAALDNAESAQSESENDVYGNGDTSGL